MLFVKQSDKGINSKKRSRTKARRLKVSDLCPPPSRAPPTADAIERNTESSMQPGSSESGVRSPIPFTPYSQDARSSLDFPSWQRERLAQHLLRRGASGCCDIGWEPLGMALAWCLDLMDDFCIEFL